MFKQIIENECKRRVRRLEAVRNMYKGYRNSRYVPETFGYQRFTLAIAFTDLKIAILKAFYEN